MPTKHEITEALRADPDYQGNIDSYLLVMLVIAYGEQSEAAGVSFRVWLDQMRAMLGEYTQ